MPPTIRVALYVFAAVAVLLGITIVLVQTPTPLATPLLVDDTGDIPVPPSLLGLSIKERGEVFRTKILAAGFACDRVRLMLRLREDPQFFESSSRVQGLESQSSSRVQLWIVDCQDGHSYSIQVDPFDPSGSAKVARAARLGPTN